MKIVTIVINVLSFNLFEILLSLVSVCFKIVCKNDQKCGRKTGGILEEDFKRE